MADADHDGRVDSLLYRYAAPTQEASGSSQPVAYTVFVDLEERSTDSHNALDRVPSGLWGMENRGHFRFDLFLMTRADGVTAVGYTNPQGIVDDVRLAQPHQDDASIIWRRSGSGGWTAAKPSAPTAMIDPARLAGKDVQRLRNILSQSGTGAAGGGFGTPEQGEHRGINEQ